MATNKSTESIDEKAFQALEEALKIDFDDLVQETPPRKENSEARVSEPASRSATKVQEKPAHQAASGETARNLAPEPAPRTPTFTPANDASRKTPAAILKSLDMRSSRGPIRMAILASVLWIIGGLSGWRALAAAYPLSVPFRGTARRFQRIQLRWAGYNGCVVVGTNADGLYLDIFFPFRFGHPPIFVPWADVSGQFVRGLFANRLELRFAAVPSVTLRLPERLARRIATDANRSWANAERA